MAPWQLYDDSNLPYVEIMSDDERESSARGRAGLLGCKCRYIPKQQETQLRKDYAEKSKELRDSAIMPSIED